MCECLFEKNLNDTEGGDCVIKEHVYPLSQSCHGRVISKLFMGICAVL